ncbi:amino acid racemase [Cytobacillus firmus]|uniref:YhfX family PLP-dependent enzyme n=1 Tax=Cytobacillus firmus TaxID=1399 RepID=UPI00077C81EF|nr:YhfX family PLP-dependent enzyme [Cytobacillus firmus]MBG9541848.1 amino acid racemase [Cytobacillus firmus]MBG9551291.1 amino acid racemase [Cytobacillus firmus]MBG9558986.1 amino acid racemase [Cytobacillus firmus]MBG9576892.1 amino acid racemase [Cytobacillus firmus]MEC1894859.1 YhfX family PLP-dependent enzyme [Cytobacillus firmus]
MFLDVTKRRNPKLIQSGVTLHQSGQIPPNTYVIDLDILGENVEALAKTAKNHDFTLYFMSKQLGRLPFIGQFIAEHGIEKAVAVEFDEAKTLAEGGVEIGNVGHLVQPGKNQWPEVLSWNPEVITLFSLARARQLSDAAVQSGTVQDVLLRVYAQGDMIYPGQQGGFRLEKLDEELLELAGLPGINIAGVTTFPNFQLSRDRRSMEPTPNFITLLKAKEVLEKKGIKVKQVNGPSATSCETIPFLAEQGVTHGEPGHALTGTTPLHAYRDLPEKPAIVYVTEVSHQDQEHYYVIGGGYYGRSHLTGCLVGSDEKEVLNQYVKAIEPAPEAIDYYGAIEKPEGFQVSEGDTAVFSFRTQVFVTRAHIALVKGIQRGKPELVHFERKW